jgi:TolA-binding protein
MKRKIAAFMLVFSLLMSFGCISVAAIQGQDDPQSRKEEMRARYAELEKKFDSLTDSQKDNIYNQNAQVLSEMKKLMQMYADSGVISQEESNRIMQSITDRNAQAQKNGNIVGVPVPRGESRPPKSS